MSSQVFASLRQFNDQYRPVGVAERTGPTATDGPLTVTADRTFGDVPDPAVVLDPGGGAPTTKTMGNQVVGDYLRQAAETVPVVESVCTGALDLAAAGLLEARLTAAAGRGQDPHHLHELEHIAPGVPSRLTAVQPQGSVANEDRVDLAPSQLTAASAERRPTSWPDILTPE